jgi:hypothetical protein
MSFDPSPENATLEALERQIDTLAGAIRPAEVFRRLLEASRTFAPRAAVFLAREGCWKGWGATGYGRDASERLRRLKLVAGDGPLDRLAVPDGEEGAVSRTADPLPDFGQPEAEDTRGIPLRVGARTIGLLIAQRGAGEEPWFPAALGILAIAARLRLELDLTLRKLQPAEKPIATQQQREDVVEPAAIAPAPEPAAVAVAPSETSVTPWLERPTEAPDNLRREEARRFARLVATDIRLYNEEAVVLGRRNRDLFRRLEEQIDRGREAFERRFPDLGAPGKAFLHEAYVEILAGGDADLLPLAAGDEPRSGATPQS